MAYENQTEEEKVEQKIKDVSRYVEEGHCDALAMDDFTTAYRRHRSSVKWSNDKAKNTISKMKEEIKRNIAEMKAQLRRAKEDKRIYRVTPRSQYAIQHENEWKVNFKAAKALGIGFRVGETYILPKKAAATPAPSSPRPTIDRVCEVCGVTFQPDEGDPTSTCSDCKGAKQ